MERSTDGYQYQHIHTLWAATGVASYEYMDTSPRDVMQYYRLRMVSKNGESTYSKVIPVNDAGGIFRIKSVTHTGGTPLCIIQSGVPRTIKLELFDMNGRCYGITRQALAKGDNNVRFTESIPSGGVYLIRGTDQAGISVSLRFFYRR